MPQVFTTPLLRFSAFGLFWVMLVTFVFPTSAEEFAPENQSLSSHGSEKKSLTLVNEPNDFHPEMMLSPGYRSSVSGFSFLNPTRFSFNQSYSVNFAAGGGSTASNGLYLNTLSYRLADPLVLSLDMGFQTPFYSHINGMPSTNLMDNGQGTSFVLPRVGLTWKPSDRTTFSLELINGADANKAYGSGFYSPFWHALER